MLRAEPRISCQLLRRLGNCRLRRVQHILNENAVTRDGIVDEDVRHRADELAVLYDR